MATLTKIMELAYYKFLTEKRSVPVPIANMACDREEVVEHLCNNYESDDPEIHMGFVKQDDIPMIDDMVNWLNYVDDLDWGGVMANLDEFSDEFDKYEEDED